MPGKILKVTNAKFSILVDKSQNLLFLKENEGILKTYTVATGMNNSTPVGTFKVKDKLISPTWYKPDGGGPIKPDNADYQLGSRWMGITADSYGIHGTKDPESIGKQITNGCVRMLNQDVEELYDIVPVGTEVTIVD